MAREGTAVAGSLANPASAMTFSVVIPTCHRDESLARCLARLEPGAQTFPASDYEVIVTDDGSRTNAAAMIRARFPWVRWYAGPKRGPAANRNFGAGHATGNWLAFIDDDCVPDRGWLDAFATVPATVEVCEGRTYVDRPRDHPLDDSPINERGGNLWACNFAIRRELFCGLGGFDIRFPYPAMEDTELRLRLERGGRKPRFVPAAGVLHPWRRIGDWRLHARRQAKSRLLLEELYPGAGFPPFHPRLVRHLSRVILAEHLPFARRRPREAVRILPSIWWAMMRDMIWCWHRPAFRDFEV